MLYPVVLLVGDVALPCFQTSVLIAPDRVHFALCRLALSVFEDLLQHSQVCLPRIRTDHSDQHFSTAAKLVGLCDSIGDSFEVATVDEVKPESLQDSPRELFVVFEPHLQVEELVQLQIDSCVAPCNEDHVEAATRKELARSLKHEPLACLLTHSHSQRCKSPLQQVLKVHFTAELYHVGLHSTIVHSFRKSLEAFGHEDVLTVGSLSLSDHARTQHRLEEHSHHFVLRLSPRLDRAQAELLLLVLSLPPCR